MIGTLCALSANGIAIIAALSAIVICLSVLLAVMLKRGIKMRKKTKN